MDWPFDSDFESEQYYDHENRLDIDEGYVEAHRQRYERMLESQQKSAKDWISLWVSKLKNCPGGPTIFYPATTRNNGEYLSQGLVNHSGRSCVLSLDMLVEAGLYSLYPELSKETYSWTKRVLELREAWSTEQVTNQREVQLALQIARQCFAGIDISDIAAILLSFKNRKCKENVNRKYLHLTPMPTY